MAIDRDQVDRCNLNSLYQTMGLSLESAADGNAVSRLDPADEVCWPFPDRAHGGVIFTQMDTTMAWALISMLPEGQSGTTIDLNIQFTGQAKDTPLTCRAKAIHRTGHLGFVRAETTDTQGNLVAQGVGTFRIIKFDINQA